VFEGTGGEVVHGRSVSDCSDIEPGRLESRARPRGDRGGEEELGAAARKG
jgi:hypothetical protein